MKYFFLLLSLVLISCAKDENKILVTGKDGLLYAQGSTTPFTGIETAYVKGKYLEYEVVKGEKHGYFKVSDSVGHRLEIYGFIKHNKYEGKWKYYYPTGKLESEGYFVNDEPSEKWEWYYPNGNLKEAGKYLEGRREGEWKYYAADGQLTLTRMFKDGQIIDDSSSTKKL